MNAAPSLPGEEKKTDYRFKLLYALGMIFIVAGHCDNGGVSIMYDWFPVYAFHLGLFAFCSGYFYKDRNEEHPLKYIARKFLSLILPVYLWNFFYALVTNIMGRFGFAMGGKGEITLYKLFVAPITSGHQYSFNVGGWFVIPLFMIMVFTVLVRKPFPKVKGLKKELPMFAIYCSAGVLGVTLAINGYNTGWWLVLTRMLFFMPFYAFGTLYKRVLERYDRLPSPVYFAVVLVLQFALIVYIGRLPRYTPSWCDNFIDGPVIPFIAGFLGIAFWLRVSRLLEPALGRSKWVNLIADNTYSIMIHQIFSFMLVKFVFAAIAALTPFFGDFDWDGFKTGTYYLYLPFGKPQSRIIYLAAGIIIPVLAGQGIKAIKKRLRGRIAKSRAEKKNEPAKQAQ